jgi:hypothetical protein
MQPSRHLIGRAALGAVLLVSALSSPAQQPYHLELESNPAAAFPYLGRFGAVELHAYSGGVRAEALWLDSFSRNGAQSVTVVNPLGRMYVDVPVDEIAPTLTRIAGRAGDLERGLAPILGPPVRGKVNGIDATRHQLIYGPSGWIDLWTTSAIPENAQLRLIAMSLVEGISPGTADVAKTIPGTPLYVELNFRRFRKVPLLKVKKLTFAADDEEEALTLGKLLIRAPLLEKLFEK